jgi:hypothetical protein
MRGDSVMKINNVYEAHNTSWTKKIEITHNDTDYCVTLHWDSDYGYDIYNWSVNGDFITTPDWVESYKSVDSSSIEKGFFALCTDLDNISYEMEKVSA